MKILIAGAGAMGCSFAHKLKEKGKNEVYLVDTWQENIDKIKKEGFNILDLGKEYNVKIDICRPEEFNKEVDLIILFVKSMMLESMLKSLKHIIGKNTKVLCLLNGLGHTETLKKYVDVENILIGVTLITANLKSMSYASLTAYASTQISCIDDKAIDFTKEVAKVLDDTGLKTTYTENLMESIWIKACVNGMFNSLCTILNSYLGELRNSDMVYEVMENIVNEFHSIALKENCNFDKKLALSKLNACITRGYVGEFHYPSMHQDLIQNKRKTEIDYLNGYISKKGKEYGIKTPYCDLITFQIKIMESKLDF